MTRADVLLAAQTHQLSAPLLSESSYWYLTRASGFISLALFSVAFTLGLLTAGRVWSPRWPRFVTESLHRSVSLVAVCMVVVHVTTILFDRYVKISVVDTVVPFVSAYLPLWVGLGAVAFDVIIALILTSLLRTRLSRFWWRTVHWLAYLGWPVALAHTVGIGTDRLWVLGVIAVSVFMVLAAGVYRVAGWRRVAVRRPI
ncbi:MAG: ferric reductase-like transmembrane domain-containing protein [Labedaea sp.]